MKLPIGTKVYDAKHGWGEVNEINEEKNTRYMVDFEKNYFWYHENGEMCSSALSLIPTLSLTPYTLEHGGFTPITEFGKPKAGDWGWFWDREFVDKRVALFGQLKATSAEIESTKEGFLLKDTAWYENFSPTPPEHIKQFLKCK